jgi:glycosyltransferase involved in cell wall biosynthesis
LASKYASRFGGEIDAILQVGATFDCPVRSQVPRYLYCDSNIALAIKGASSQQSPAVWLSQEELREIWRREAETYGKTTGIFTMSERLRRSFMEDFGVENHRVTTVYAGANFGAADLPPLEACRAARAAAPPTILFVGAQFDRKGGGVLLDAFRTVRREIPKARLVVVGCDAGGGLPGVEARGFLDKNQPEERRRLLEAYQSATVFCLPTRFEPFGIVFIEAMMFYLPCLGTQTSAVPEIIEAGKTGYTVPVNDSQALAERLIYLLRHPEVAQRMGEAGRDRAEERFTWAAVVRKMTCAMSLCQINSIA